MRTTAPNNCRAHHSWSRYEPSRIETLLRPNPPASQWPSSRIKHKVPMSRYHHPKANIRTAMPW